MKKIICLFKGHRRGYTKRMRNGLWRIKCKRCDYRIDYWSASVRLIGIEIIFGFDGK